jgi:hypothetical protein
MPLNRKMRDLVVTQAHLLDQDKMPDCLLELCAHVSTYEAILGQWGGGRLFAARVSRPVPAAGTHTLRRRVLRATQEQAA